MKKIFSHIHIFVGIALIICTLLTNLLFVDVSYASDPSASLPDPSASSTEEEETSPYMTQIDPKTILDPESQQETGSSLTMLGVTVLRSITNMLLPIVLIVVAFNSIYIAIFPVLAGVDPLGQTASGSRLVEKYDIFSDSPNGSGGRNNSDHSANAIRENGKKILKASLADTFKGVFIVLAIWLAIQLIMWVVVLLLSNLHF